MDGRESITKLRTLPHTLVQAFFQLTWPPSCDYCGETVQESHFFLCQSCWENILRCTAGDYCPRCGCDVSPYALVAGRCARCQDQDIAWDGIFRCGIYTDLLQGMILAFKNDRTELRRVLGFLASQAIAGTPSVELFQMWIPVPLHWTRRLRRGYNQAEVLVHALGFPDTPIRRVLKRNRRTQAQPVVATRAARARNVAGAFTVTEPASILGATVCLVDDIKTTGATLNECARTLKVAGAARVYALVLAVAGQTAG